MMARAAAELSSRGIYAGIDINMGCPARKIAGAGEGCGLMKTPVLAGQIMEAVVRASSLPVTIKCRLGWDADHINVLELAHIAEESGIAGIAVHGRTREQMYMGSADWDAIARVKQSVKIPVYGNGDIFSAEDAMQRLGESGVDGLLIGRGAMGDPWIFRRIRQALHGEPITRTTSQERLETILRHYDLMLAWKPQRIAVAEMRKHIAWYLHGLRGAAQLRTRIDRMEDPNEVKALLTASIIEEELS